MNNLPFVSIIIPVRNEALFIERGLLAILQQDYPADKMEVLLADGMSVDHTRTFVNNLRAVNSQIKMDILDNLAKIVPTGMNIALRRSKGEIIIRVDGHCIIAKDYVRKCVEHIQKDGVDGVGGPMESIGETRIAKAIAMGMSSPFGVGNSAFRTISGKSMLTDTVPFPAYTRKIIESAGFYDEELVRNQDDEYNYRIRELGGKILLAEDVRSTYFSRTSLKGLWRQYFQYGYWKVRVLQKHPRQMSLRQFVPPLFVLGLAGSGLMAVWPVFSALAPVVPLVYLAANLVASVITSAKKGWKHLPLLPLIFAMLHLSYGLGFLLGLVRFANRWGDRRGKVPDWTYG
jgi:succinoglycan biosynthesis protein ExoA